jgi:hypothetical protein
MGQVVSRMVSKQSSKGEFSARFRAICRNACQDYNLLSRNIEIIMFIKHI